MNEWDNLNFGLGGLLILSGAKTRSISAENPKGEVGVGLWPKDKFQPLSDDIASIGYWYQSEPDGEFPEFPTIEMRWAR